MKSGMAQALSGELVPTDLFPSDSLTGAPGLWGTNGGLRRGAIRAIPMRFDVVTLGFVVHVANFQPGDGESETIGFGAGVQGSVMVFDFAYHRATKKPTSFGGLRTGAEPAQMTWARGSTGDVIPAFQRYRWLSECLVTS